MSNHPERQRERRNGPIPDMVTTPDFKRPFFSAFDADLDTLI